MIHLDLFSGIGGFALAAEAIWPDITHTFVEYDPYCQQVLRKHWPQAEIHGDIRQFITDTEHVRPPDKESKTDKGFTQQRNNPWKDKEKTFILTGGFPCQPFSQAGRRKGTADNRYLWPEMFRVIQLTQPTWVIAENVRGLVTWNDGLVLEQVCADLESEGYEVQPLIIPAVAVNAPHRRDRVWIVAHAIGNRKTEAKRRGNGETESIPRINRKKNSPTRRVGGAASDERLIPWGNDGHDDDASDTSNKGLQGRSKETTGYSGQRSGERSNEGYDWNQNWIEVATELCGVDDGLPARLDGFELSKSAHRRERLKSLGNSIVPQVTYQIMLSILQCSQRRGKTK